MIGLGSEKNHMCNNLTLWLPALILWLKPSHLHYIHPQVCVKWRIILVLATGWWTVVVTDLGGNFNRGNFAPRHVTSTTLTFRALLIPRSLWSSLSSSCLLDCELFIFCLAHWRNIFFVNCILDKITPFFSHLKIQLAIPTSNRSSIIVRPVLFGVWYLFLSPVLNKKKINFV